MIYGHTCIQQAGRAYKNVNSVTVEHKSRFLSPTCHEWQFSSSCNNWHQFAGYSHRLHKQADWGRHRMIQPFYTNQLFPTPPFTLWVHMFSISESHQKCSIYVQCLANLSGPYLPIYGPHLWFFLFAVAVKNCQWWHLSNVTKVKRQSCSGAQDKKFNYKTPRGEEKGHCALEPKLLLYEFNEML